MAKSEVAFGAILAQIYETLSNRPMPKQSCNPLVCITISWYILKAFNIFL